MLRAQSISVRRPSIPTCTLAPSFLAFNSPHGNTNLINTVHFNPIYRVIVASLTSHTYIFLNTPYGTHLFSKHLLRVRCSQCPMEHANPHSTPTTNPNTPQRRPLALTRPRRGGLSKMHSKMPTKRVRTYGNCSGYFLNHQSGHCSWSSTVYRYSLK